MNREQIIKALELRSNEAMPCVNECPYGDMRYCGSAMAKDALALINELTEANERLKDTISRLGKNNDELARVLPLAKKEIEVETASEIFEEIEKCLSPYRYPIVAELKKKSPGGE